MSKRSALLWVGSWLSLFAIVELSARSILRVWVDSQRDRWVLPYDGSLLLLSGGILMLASLTLVVFALNTKPGAASAPLLNAGLTLMGASTLGITSAGLCQAGLHVARLAIPGGLLHPRSLVICSLAIACAACLIYALALSPRADPQRR